MPTLSQLQKEIKSLSDLLYAKNLAWFFKTGKGEYGEGDKFRGLNVPTCRQLAKKFSDLTLTELDKLIRSKYHEERLIALLILVEKFSLASKHPKMSEGFAFRRLAEVEKTKIYKFYLAHTKWINNWDLVDLSAPKIIGPYLFSRFQNRKAKPSDKYPILFKLARSKNIWERRIAILATFDFIKNDKYETSLALAETLLHDTHDLIHKAVGWMLREVGNRSISDETVFLQKHYRTMPRTMLRYAIEKFPEEIRIGYLKGSI